MKAGIFLAIITLCALHGQSLRGQDTAENHPPIDFEADALEYQESRQVILASGNVVVRQSSYTFFSDKAKFDIPNKSLEASGSVRFMDAQKNEIRSRLLSYDSEKKSARLLDAKGSFGPWIFAAKKVERDDIGNFTLTRARLTTCGTNLSNYHLYGYKIRVMPQKRLTVTHAIFRLGPIPVLYLPFYYHSLGEKHLAFQIIPGSNQNEGAFARTIWGYPFTDTTYTRVYLDHLSKRGFGTGGEVNYYNGDKVKGSVYGYRIRDKITDRERWNARLAHWQRLTPGLILQSNINKLSDDEFPNDFFREDFNRVVKDFRSSVALTYRRKDLLLRVVGERFDVFRSTGEGFVADDALAPKFSLEYFQSPLGFLGIDKILSASFTNRFSGRGKTGQLLNRRYRRESDARFSLLRRFRLFRRTTLIPRLTIRNQWLDSPQGSELEENFVQRLDTEATFRQRFGYFMDVDLNYILSQRFQQNSGVDLGREIHQLTFHSSIRPARWVDFRFDTGYNLPRLKGETLPFLERSKYQPLRGELNLRPRQDIDIFIKEVYILSDGITGSPHPLSTQSEIAVGRRRNGGNYFSFGTSYFSSRDSAFEFISAGRLNISRKYSLEGKLRTLISYRKANFLDVKAGELIEKELTARSSWRCWDIMFTFRERSRVGDRGSVQEFLFNIELKLDSLDPRSSKRTSQESEWYPWRGD